MHISQSLIKECLKKDHCPKQVYYSFIEGKELIEPSASMLIGRYFESELLGACRGGAKQEATMINKGKEKAQAYKDCDDLILFANDIFKKLGININPENVQLELKTDYLSAHLDLISNDIENKDSEAIYDVKWTATKEDDRWNGWANPEEKEDSIIQAAHYVLTYYMKYEKWIPFYFLVFGKDKWVKVIRFKLTEETIEVHKQRISYTAHLIEEYAENNYKGKGSFNKCLSCPFNEECPDKVTYPEIEVYTI